MPLTFRQGIERSPSTCFCHFLKLSFELIRHYFVTLRVYLESASILLCVLNSKVWQFKNSMSFRSETIGYMFYGFRAANAFLNQQNENKRLKINFFSRYVKNNCDFANLLAEKPHKHTRFFIIHSHRKPQNLLIFLRCVQIEGDLFM